MFLDKLNEAEKLNDDILRHLNEKFKLSSSNADVSIAYLYNDGNKIKDDALR